MFRFLLFLPVLMNFTATYSQSKKTIDSINKLYVQGLNIPQDSIVALFQQNLKDAEKISQTRTEISTIEESISKLKMLNVNSQKTLLKRPD